MIRIAVIGVGHWGPNLVRNFNGLGDCQVTVVCDRDARRLQSICEKFPSVYPTTDATEVFNGDGKIDAVVIATPTKTHYPLAKQALERGYHTFVEKPLATSSDECMELIELADSTNLVLFVGHVFLYSAPVVKLIELVLNGELGDLYYISSRRLNLGPVRQDVSALWDLAPHDVYIMLELMDAMPSTVSCSGLARLNDSLHDVCAITVHFEGRRMGLLHVSWLDPHKSRVMTVVGSKRMAIYNDIDPLEKIKIYDRGVDVPPDADSLGEFQLSYRYGDTYSPRIVEGEPLKAECRSFVASILQGTSPKTDGYNGLQVVRVIEAAERSLQNGGGEIAVERTSHDGNARNGPRSLVRADGLPLDSPFSMRTGRR